MGREMTFRTLAGSMFIAMAFALPSPNIGFSQEPTRLGDGQVSSIALNPDGTVLAAAHRTDPQSDIYATQVVILWELEMQEQLDVFDVQDTYALTFSPDGTLLASGGGEDIVRLWDVTGRNSVKAMKSPTLYGVNALAFSPDGKTLASAGYGSNAVTLWDVQTGQQSGTLRKHTPQSIIAVVFSPDGRWLFSGGHRDDEAIRVWDVQTQEQVGELTGHLDITYDLAFSPDGTILASAGGWYDMAVYLWDAQTWDQVGVLAGHSAHVLSVAFSPDGRLLASTMNWNNTIYLWDVESQALERVLEGHDAMDSGTRSELASSPDGSWLACGSEIGVELWELNLPGAVSRVCAFGPRPFDGALHADTFVNLRWRPGDLALSDNVYLGNSFDDVNEATPDSGVFRGNQTATSYEAGLPGLAYPDGLVRGTTYYWRIDGINDANPDSPWRGPVWNFFIQPEIAYDPVPANGAEPVDVNVELSWKAGVGAASHIVYFGDDLNEVNDATTGGLRQQTTTHSPGPLEPATTYYWRVDESEDRRGVEIRKGDIWSFTTGGAVESL